MPKASFKQIKTGPNRARSGRLNTRAGTVNTPFFMPVATRGAVKGLSPDQVSGTGAPVLLSNTYHLLVQPGEKIVKALGGIHIFNHWAGPILTDSGGFQVFSLAKIRKITEEGVHFQDPKSGNSFFISPELSVQIQLDLGADIIMAFDDVVGLSLAERGRTEEALERTHRWLVRCSREFKKRTKNLPPSQRPLLFGIAQGGLDKKLRIKSIEFVQSQEVDGLAIGGLSVGESRAEMHSMLKFMTPIYEPKLVRYLMGVGHPIDMRLAIENGIDMFDCVLPTRNARHGQVWVSGDTSLNLNNQQFIKDKGVIDKACDCATCQAGYSRAYLRQLYKTNNSLGGSLASVHNLRYLQRICEDYK